MRGCGRANDVRELEDKTMTDQMTDENPHNIYGPTGEEYSTGDRTTEEVQEHLAQKLRQSNEEYEYFSEEEEESVNAFYKNFITEHMGLEYTDNEFDENILDIEAI